MDRAIQVLLVEDSPTDVLLAKDALSPTRFNMETCSTLGEALALLASPHFEVVLLDLGLPDSQGLDTLRKLRGVNREVAIVVLTGQHDDVQALQALHEGAQDYLVKAWNQPDPIPRAIRYAMERNAYDEALRRSRHQMQKAQMRAHIGNWELDVASNHGIWSDELYRIYGLDIEGHGSSPQLTVSILPADRAGVEQQMRTAMEDGGADFHFDYRIVLSDGSIRYLELRGESFLGADHRPERLEGTVQDVTNRVNNETRLRAILDNVSEAILMLDSQSIIQSANTASEAMTGYSAEELVGQPVHNLTPAEAQPQMAGLLQQMFDGHVTTVAGMEVMSVRRDGSQFPIELSLNAFSLGEARFVIGVARDVSERRDRESRMRALLDNISDAIITSDEHGILQSFNRAAENIFGYAEAELLGTNVFVLAEPEQRPFFEATVARMARGEQGELRGIESIGQRKDGSLFPFDISLNVFSLVDRRYVIGVLRDATARKAAEEERGKLEEQLRQSQKMEAVGRLAGGVAHDFNNMLTVINGYSEIVLSDLPADSPHREPLQEILQAGERAALITQQLLAFSRQQVMTPRILNLNTVVHDTEKMLLRLIGEDISIATTLDPTLYRIKVDSGQVVQVLMNLAVNARDAMPQGGRLTIKTSNFYCDSERAAIMPEYSVGRYVLLSISDNGCGMSPAVRSRIFEPFFTTKDPGKGTGLGLATVFGIIKQSGGNIEVYSEPNFGSTFRIYLPAHVDSVRELEMHEAALPTPRGTETLLLVEDEAGVRTIAVRVLEKLGYTVLAAAGAEEALGISAGHAGRIDLLLTDVVMPEMNGRELADEIYRVRPETRALFMSGYTDDAILRHGLIYKDVAFIQKPFTPASLAQKVRQVLDQPELPPPVA